MNAVVITRLDNFFSQMTLLYAEDEPVAQALYEAYFKLHFKTVYIAANGKQALQLYENNKPDIIVLDINMPLLNGLEVCRAIRKNDKETKIILLTARSDKEALLEAVELGLTTYLEKPVQKEHLNKVLLKLLDEFDQSSKKLICTYNERSFIWDTKQRELFCDSDILILTKKEKLLLELLLTSHHDKVNYERIYEIVWCEDYNMENYSEASIKTLIKKLRTKLPPKTIKNTYGLGYYL